MYGQRQRNRISLTFFNRENSFLSARPPGKCDEVGACVGQIGLLSNKGMHRYIHSNPCNGCDKVCILSVRQVAFRSGDKADRKKIYLYLI